MESLKQQLEIAHSIVQKATDAKVQLQEAASKEPTKFSTFKAAGGTIDDFFKGLEDRIGEHVDMFLTQEGCYITPCCVTFVCVSTGAPNLNFKKGMCAEHTTQSGYNFTFTTGNYKITTTPSKEWQYVIGVDEKGQTVRCNDRSHGREIKPIDELMKKPLAIKAKLTVEEMIAVVLYTGVFDYHYPLVTHYSSFLRCSRVTHPAVMFHFRSNVCHLQRNPPPVPSRHLQCLQNRQHVSHYHFCSCQRCSKIVPLHEHSRWYPPFSWPWRLHGATRHLLCSQRQVHDA